jgi:primosomal protein N' (replication factor Y)
MRYAKVVVGLPVEGPFDYFIPPELNQRIRVGVRVKVEFGHKKLPGYVVGVVGETFIKNPKAVLEAIDNTPLLDSRMLWLTKELSDYYCCSWGQAIETALPHALRTTKKIALTEQKKRKPAAGSREVILLHDLDGKGRWDAYIQHLRQALDNNQAALVIVSESHSLPKAKAIIENKLDTTPAVLYRNRPGEIKEWLSIKEGRASIALGLRSAIFAPLSNLGLVIIDQEDDSVYKQDQVPHYHVRVVAMMRAKKEKAKLILGSSHPSLESYYLAKKGRIQYSLIPRKREFPQIKLVNTSSDYAARKKNEVILSAYLLDALRSVLNNKGKVLLFLNRRGFASKAFCRHCNKIFKCPRCSINLVYHFKESMLRCHYCNFKMPAPAICPDCNSDYIRYLGMGAERLENEINRLFPQARVKRVDKIGDLEDKQTDIFIATSLIVKATGLNFDLIGVLSVDEALNYIDFRAPEKVFRNLSGLLGLTEKSLVIQTRLNQHHCFQALLNKDSDFFYKEELRQRRQLSFPPYRHLAYVVLRGRKEAKVKGASEALFARLNNNCPKGIRILSLNPAQPQKLRGNFYWRILLRGSSAKNVTRFLKINLKGYSHSGIIVTVDLDPI